MNVSAKRRVRGFARVGAALLLLAATPTVFAVDADDVLDGNWHHYASAHFHVYSNLPEERVAERIRELELMREVVFRITNARKFDDIVPVDFYLPRTPRIAAAFLDNPSAAGFANVSLRSFSLVADVGGFALEQQVIVLHEFVHYLLRGAGVPSVPHWYDEGLAEMLSTTTTRGDRVIVGMDNPARVRGLSSPTRVSLRDVVTARSTADWHPYRVSYFYSMSWALTHYLHAGHLMGGKERLPELQAFLGHHRRGDLPADRAFEQSFGSTFGDMEREIGKYLSRSQRPVLSLPVHLFPFDATYRREPVARADIALRAGYLALGNEDLARALFEAAAESPAHRARARAGDGVVFQIAKEYDKAEASMREAIALAPDDTIVTQELIDLLALRCRDDPLPGRCADLRQEAIDLGNAILARTPANLEAQAALGTLLIEIGGSPERARTLLAAVHAAAPWHLGIYPPLAIADAHAGDFAHADELLALAEAISENEEYLSAIRLAGQRVADLRRQRARRAETEATATTEEEG